MLPLAAALACLLPLTAGAAGIRRSAVERLPDDVWAVSIGARQTSHLTRSFLANLRQNGINTLVLDPAHTPKRRLTRARAAAIKSGLLVLTPLSSRRLTLTGPPGAATAMCRAEKKRHPRRLCSLRAGSTRRTAALARKRGVNVVVVDVQSAADLRYLQKTRGKVRVIAILKLGKRIDTKGWQTAIEIARGSSKLDLAAAPIVLPGALGAYLGLLNSLLDPPAPLPPPPLPPPPDLANLWVDPDGGSCTRSATAVPYDDAAACSSLQAALAACTAGDTGIVKSGSYGAQTITAVTDCTLTAESGATIGPLADDGSNHTLTDFVVDVGDGHAPGGLAASGTDLTFNNLALHGAYVSASFSGGQDIIWNGGELGEAGVVGGQRACANGDTEPLTIKNDDHITIQYVTFHPQDHVTTLDCGSSNGFHLEMVRIDSNASFLSFCNNTFDSGDRSNTASIFITDIANTAGTDPHDLYFCQNFIGTAGNNSFSIHTNVDTCTNFWWDYNTTLEGMGSPSLGGACGERTGMRWVGNLSSRSSFSDCIGTHSKNVWQDSQAGSGNSSTFGCGTDQVVIGTRFATDVLGINSDFSLTAGFPAREAGENRYCPATDHNGTPRPTFTPCDAGGWQHG